VEQSFLPTAPTSLCEIACPFYTAQIFSPDNSQAMIKQSQRQEKCAVRLS
jgi:hypothetical protein